MENEKITTLFNQIQEQIEKLEVEFEKQKSEMSSSKMRDNISKRMAYNDVLHMILKLF